MVKVLLILYIHIELSLCIFQLPLCENQFCTKNNMYVYLKNSAICRNFVQYKGNVNTFNVIRFMRLAGKNYWHASFTNHIVLLDIEIANSIVFI